MSHSQDIAHSKDYVFSKETTPQTFTGNQGLFMEEPLVFEQDTPGLTGVDWPDVEVQDIYLAGLRRQSIDLPGLSEPQVVRHYTRLSQKNYSIDAGLYPLGSCTMKHNPRLNEKVARMFSDIHPPSTHFYRTRRIGCYSPVIQLANGFNWNAGGCHDTSGRCPW